MKAVAVSAFKAVPQIMELPEPDVKPGTIKIRLAAAGLNPYDWKLVDGIMDGHMPHTFPMILGTDGAGVVTATGEGVTRFRKGDRVYGQVLHAPIGEGSYAVYVVVPENARITHAPEKISLSEAAAVPTAGMTGAQLLEKSGLRAGQTLLLIGATGGVGSFTVQLAKAKGIQVIGTAGSAEEAERLRSLGATTIINYKETPVRETVRQQYPAGVDGLIDLINNAAGFTTMMTLVKKGGAALTTLFVADQHAIEAQGLHGGNFETKGSPASLDVLKQAIDAGQLKVPVDQKISLEEAPAAIADSRERKSRGKTIILINDQL